MVREEAEKQKQKAKEMLGISDDRAQEIFEQQPDRKQQKRKKLKEEGKLEKVEGQAQSNPESVETGPEETAEPEPEPEEETEDEGEEVELVECPECGDEFDSSRGMKVHKSQVH
jgi:hypothetical protein